MPARRSRSSTSGANRAVAPLRQELVDVAAIAQVGRDAAGRRVRLAHVAQLFEPGHDVPRSVADDTPKPRLASHSEEIGSPVVDVGLDQRAEDPPISFR